MHSKASKDSPLKGATQEIYQGHFKDGEFLRPDTRYRRWVKRDGSSLFRPEANRYHLYVSAACPWSQRVMIMRDIRGLENAISMSITDPVWNERGWCFAGDPEGVPDVVNRRRDVIDLYRMVDPSFDEDETVPILWDKHESTIVNNESVEIMRMFDHEFRDLGDSSIDLCPEDLSDKVDETIARLYQPVNNGVYRAGFARNQKAYEKSVQELFNALSDWDRLLGNQRYLCGDRLTEADIAFYVTLVRFDCVYHGHFKCNLKRIADYENLWLYLCELYRIPAFEKTTNFRHIKEHYYRSHKSINPTGVVPLGPLLEFDAPPREVA